MITQEMAPGSRVPIHLHEREDEIIYIQRGQGRGDLDGRSVPLKAGSMLYVPQGTWHGGENTGKDVLLWVAIYSPSGSRATSARSPSGRTPARRGACPPPSESSSTESTASAIPARRNRSDLYRP
jgi:oxalate decarboxylase/phosphoglucose isomerase-like protein (cupin superfamily)